MKTYYAGQLGWTSEEETVFKKGQERLFSYHLINAGKDKCFQTVIQLIKDNPEKNLSLFLDSGAFSAWSKGIEINIQEYIDFIKTYQEQIKVYAVLDSIGDPEKTLRNQIIMEEAGLDPLPCYHYGEPLEYLENYVKEYDYLALGGMVPISKKDLQLWLDMIFADYICDENGMPKTRVHGFGMTIFKLIRRYPWYSVDSTSWIMTSRMGGLFVPQFKNDDWAYILDPIKINMSHRSPKKENNGQHYDTLNPSIQKLYLKYFIEKGFTLQELQEKYVQRDLLNLEYFHGFQSCQPKYPWPFACKGLRGLCL